MTQPPPPMSQDGGDGEHASIIVSQGIRDLIQTHNYDGWLPEFGESPTGSTDVATVFSLRVGDTDFDLVLTRAGE